MIVRVITIAIAAATIAPTTAAIADEPAAPAAATESLRVVRDPQTGELRPPTQEELQEMIQAEQAATARARGPAAAAAGQPLEVREYPNGMKSVVLGPEHLISIEARREADGKLVVTHEHPQDEHPVTKRDLPTE